MTALAAGAPPHNDSGRLEIHEKLFSRFLENARDIIVFLPPGYDGDTERRYPVLYMHDGQNLFDPATAFAGQVWGVDKTLSRLVAQGAVEPTIVVGIYNTGIHRIDEYTPSRDARFKQGGKAHIYGRFLVEEVKPFVDRLYRTRPESDATGLAGSSLGGLVTLHLGIEHSSVFGRLAALSPSVWWNDNEVVKRVAALAVKPPSKVWLDMGTREGSGHVQRARMLRDTLVERGWSPGVDLAYHEARNAHHSERAWARRVGPFVRFLFPSAAAPSAMGLRDVREGDVVDE